MAEQVLKAAPYKATVVRPLTTHHKIIQVRWTRRGGHCWRSKDELIRDVLLWTPSRGRAKPRRPARTYIQQLCANTGCSLEDLPEAMDERAGWSQGDPCWWCVMMMMMMIMTVTHFVLFLLWFFLSFWIVYTHL